MNAYAGASFRIAQDAADIVLRLRDVVSAEGLQKQSVPLLFAFQPLEKIEERRFPLSYASSPKPGKIAAKPAMTRLQAKSRKLIAERIGTSPMTVSRLLKRAA
jgi:hypothetical protein